jgi:hypothetical protein
MRLSKSRAETRHEAITCLLSRPWVRDGGVEIHDPDDALANENQFDALVTAAGLLRLVIEGDPLSSGAFEDPFAEGRILGTGAINFDLPEGDFVPDPYKDGRETLSRSLYCAEPSFRPGSPAQFRCPISNCTKVFVGSRGGWDAHVGSFRMHPTWEPEIKDHRQRLSVFREQYPEFFG